MTATDAAPFTPDTLGEAMATWIESKVGVTETAPNSGPEIDEWLRLVGLPPGNEWCAATVYAAGHFSALELGMVNPVPKTAGAQSLYRLTEPMCRVDGPARGRVGIVPHEGGKGHAVICVSVDAAGVPTCGSGNTNAAGSRLGNCVALHTGDPTVVHHGIGQTKWLDYNLAAQPPPGFAA